MAGISEFIQNYIGLKQLKVQEAQIRNQAEQAAANRSVTGIGEFLNAVRTTPDPVLQRGLAQHFASIGIAPEHVLMELAAGTTPTTETLRAYSTKEGMKGAAGLPTDSSTAASTARNTEAANINTTGMNAGQLGASNFLAGVYNKAAGMGISDAQTAEFISQQVTGMNRQGAATSSVMAPLIQASQPTQSQIAELRSRLFSGLNLGDASLSAGLASLSPGEQQQRAGVAAGTRMSAGQAAGNETAWAGIRLNERGLIQQGALAEAGLQIDKLRTNAQFLAAQSKASGMDPAAINDALGGKAGIIKAIDASKGNLTDAALESFASALTGYNQQLQRAGIANEGVVTGAMLKQSFWSFLPGNSAPTPVPFNAPVRKP